MVVTENVRTERLTQTSLNRAKYYLQLEVLLHGGVRDQRLSLVRPLPEPQDDGHVADEDGDEGQHELGHRREEAVRNPGAIERV